jgi:hypothetical protein
MTTTPAVYDFIIEQLADDRCQWSVGTFGAIAEFMRDPDELADVTRGEAEVSVATSRGAIRIGSREEMRLVASETASGESWSHRVALCLPEDQCAMSRRAVVSELGPDTAAIRPQDRDGVLFDLGLNALQVDVCVRSADDKTIARLRAGVGRPLFDPENPAMGAILEANPHRVFACGIGRIEVYQPIPSANGRSPEGPHTHLLPKLLRSGLTHPATEPIPEGWVPCAHVYPAHPAKDALGRRRAFDGERHSAFQQILRTFGDADLVSIKAEVLAAIRRGDDPSSVVLANSRFARGAIRLAIRQLQAAGESPSSLRAWASMHDRPAAHDVEQETGHPAC